MALPRRVVGLALAAAGFASAAGAESFEASCQFAEALGDKLHLPDMGIRYLEGVTAPPEGKDLRVKTLIGLLDLQMREEGDAAKKEALTKKARELAEPHLAKLLAKPQPGKPRPAVTLADFRIALAILRIGQGEARGAADAGPRLVKLHAQGQEIFGVLESSDFGDDKLYEKLDVMVEFQMVDGATALQMKGVSGLSAAERLKALRDAVTSFDWARAAFEEEGSTAIGFPNAYLFQAQALLAVAAEAKAAGDAPAGQEAAKQAKELLEALLKNPPAEGVQPGQFDTARYEAAKFLLDAADPADPAAAAQILQLYRGSKLPKSQDRVDLLDARVRLARARALQEKKTLGFEKIREEAAAILRRLKDEGGPQALEAEGLLASLEGGTAARGRNWRQEAEEAMKAKNYDEAERKFRALIAAAARNDKQAAIGWFGLAESYRERQRLFQAQFAYERAARLAPAWDRAGFAAALAVSTFQAAIKDAALPAAATRARKTESLRLLAGQSDARLAVQIAAANYSLGWLEMADRNYEGALGYLGRITAGDEAHAEAQNAIGRCYVQLWRDRKTPDLAAKAEAAFAAFEEAAVKAPKEKNLGPIAAESAILRIELLLETDPAKAVALAEAYPKNYPDAAAERAHELAALQALARAAKGDFAGSRALWEKAAQATREKKPWPLARPTQNLLKLVQGKDAAFAAVLANEIAARKPFNFKDAADRFAENYKGKRYAEALMAGEQILENDVHNNPAYKDNPEVAKWLRWFLRAMGEVYVETQVWSRAVPLLSRLQDDLFIIKGYNKPGKDGLPPPIEAEDLPLWKSVAVACTRAALDMPAGDERRACALRGSDAWTRLLDGIDSQHPDFWPTILDAFRAEVLAGKYSAARDRVHGLWISFPDLGGHKDRFVEALRDLAPKEPGFDEASAQLMKELQGGGDESPE